LRRKRRNRERTRERSSPHETRDETDASRSRGEAIATAPCTPPPLRVPIPSSGAPRADPTPRAIALPYDRSLARFSFVHSTKIPFRPFSARFSQETTPNAKGRRFCLAKRQTFVCTGNKRTRERLWVALFLSLPLSLRSCPQAMHHVENIGPLVESERERAKESRMEPWRTGACGWMRTCVCVRARKSGVRDKKLRGVNDGRTKRIGPPRTRSISVKVCLFSISVCDYRASLAKFSVAITYSILPVCVLTRGRKRKYVEYITLLIKFTHICQKKLTIRKLKI